MRVDRMVAEGEILTPDDRWEQGLDHHPQSEEIYQFISALDAATNDEFDFKSGGDGDNGESLMYLLDCYFAYKGVQTDRRINELERENQRLKASLTDDGK